MILCMNEIAWLAQRSSWPAADHQTLIAVAWAESKGNTDAIGTNASVRDVPMTGWTALSASQDLGLMQINNYWYGAKYMVGKQLDWRDPADNLELAHYAWNEGMTWTKWTTFKNGTHAPFMPGAATALKAPLAPPIPVTLGHVDSLRLQLNVQAKVLAEIRLLADTSATQGVALTRDVAKVTKHFA